MLEKSERTRGTWVGLLLLAIGIAIGSIARPSRWRERSLVSPAPAAVEELAPQLAPATQRETPPANGLRTIDLVIPESSARALQAVRDAAIERGIIVQGDDADMVPGELVFEGRRHPIELRIKGDWSDHVEGERWSYRIQMKSGSFLGMREFSIQAPHTRGYLWEWLVQEAARRERVLVPRSTFLHVVQNGHHMGVYFLEEHFKKELLEAQGRREGPIVVWDESTLWSALLSEGHVPARGVRGFESALQRPAHALASAQTRAYGEKSLVAAGLSDALFAAVDQMKALRALALVEEDDAGRLRVLQAQQDLRGRTLEELVDVERLACAHALASVFQLEHSLAWHNMRFYRDPAQGRLEPILFDNAAQEPSARDPVPFRAHGLTAAFAASPRYCDAHFEHLGRMLRSEWLDELFASIAPDLARHEAALRADGPLPAGFAPDEMKQRLRAQIVYLRKACLTADPVNFEASYRLADSGEAPGTGTLEVSAWATSRSPVALERFVFSNGSFALAAECLAPDQLGAHLRRSGDGDAPPVVVLPTDGRPVDFRFPMDARLANLETVDKVTRAVRAELRADTLLDLDVTAVFRLLAAEEPQEELLVFRRLPPDGPLGPDRPAAPALGEALERHPFLSYDFARRELAAPAGTWDVQGDLVLPVGVGLALGPGTTLRFAEGAVLVADAPLSFDGRMDAAIVLEPAPGAASWGGVSVLGATGRSRWTHVTVRKAAAATRGGWKTQGGVTFHRAPLALEGCRFEGSVAAAALSVFDADVELDRTTFTGCSGDGLAGGYVTGAIAGCTFEDGAGDGLELAGSDVTVRDCRFLRLGQRACAFAAASRARVEGGSAEDVALGILGQDGSAVEVARFTVRGARTHALAALRGDPAHGVTRLVARAVVLEDSERGDAFAETGCVLELDGVLVPPRDGSEEALGPAR